MSRSTVTLSTGKLAPACHTCGALMPQELRAIVRAKLTADLAQDFLRTTIALRCRCGAMHVAHTTIADVDMANG